MGLRDGQIRRWAYQGVGWSLLPLTLHRETSTYTPGVGDTVTKTDIEIPRCGYPDGVTDRFRTEAVLAADESLVVLYRQALENAGVRVNQGDVFTMEGRRGTIVSAAESKSGTRIVCRVKVVRA